MHRKTKRGHNRFIKRKHHSNTRRVQRGGALHVELGRDRLPRDGAHYNIIQTELHADGSPHIIYYGRAKAIYPPAPQICRESTRCQEPTPVYLFDGKGKLIEFVQNGSFSIYEGRFTNQKKDGRGKLSYFAATPLLDQFRDITMESLNAMTPDQFTELINQLSQYTTPSMVYNGIWDNDAMPVVGNVTFADGTVYTGQLENGFMSGHGTCRLSNGSVYKGRFLNNEISGFGKLNSINGDVYVGHFQHNVYSGKGQMTYANGDVYYGDWRNNAMNGKGVLTTHNKTHYDRYVGDWVDGWMHGIGILYAPDGTTILHEGRMEHGEPMLAFGRRGFSSQATPAIFHAAPGVQNHSNIFTSN